jgi:phosphate transport system permease protein
MAGATLDAPPAGVTPVRPPRQSTATWPLIDRLCYVLCWAIGIGLCLFAGWIVLYFLIKGVGYLKLSMFVTSPAASQLQSQSGGFKDPIIGTFVVTAIGIAIAAPLGIAIATWLSEYGRPAALARIVESAIEMLAGVPSIVLALFGLIVFSQGFLSFLSQGTANGSLGESFVNAGIVMAPLALPLVVGSTREGLDQLPSRMREASLALGKTRATTARHVLLPATRPSIAAGVVLGMGRIIGDTAIIFVMLGATLRNEGVGGTPVVSALRGTGSTLTSYIYEFSPAGEGNSPQKAYAAAFVLLMVVVALNALVTRLTDAGRDSRRLPSMLLRFSWPGWRLTGWTR